MTPRKPDPSSKDSSAICILLGSVSGDAVEAVKEMTSEGNNPMRTIGRPRGSFAGGRLSHFVCNSYANTVETMDTTNTYLPYFGRNNTLLTHSPLEAARGRRFKSSRPDRVKTPKRESFFHG